MENKEEQPVEQTQNKEEENLLEIKLHITKTNHEPALELRKTFTVCEKNNAFLKELLEASFSEKPIVSKIRISFNDKLKAKIKLEELGIKL